MARSQDIVLLSYLLSAVAQGDIATLISHSFDALRPGGRLIIHDFMPDDDEQGPALAAQWFLVKLAFEPDASSCSAATLIDLSVRRGFVNAAARVLIPETAKLVICEKPA